MSHEPYCAWCNARHKTTPECTRRPTPPAAEGKEGAHHRAHHKVIMSSVRLGSWMSAALDDPSVCAEMKADIEEWFSAGEPVVGWGGLGRIQALLDAPIQGRTGDAWERGRRSGLKEAFNAALSHTPAPAAEPVAVKKTLTLSLTDEEMAALEALAKAKDLEPPTIFRQALKLYQRADHEERHGSIPRGPLGLTPQQPVEISREEIEAEVKRSVSRARNIRAYRQDIRQDQADQIVRDGTDAILSKLSGYPLVEEKQHVAAGVEASGDGSLPVPPEPPRSAGGET